MSNRVHIPGQQVGRRTLLRAAATGAVTAAVATADPLPKSVTRLLAEGVMTPETVISRQPLTLPPDLIAALRAGAQVRARVEYPFRRDLLVFKAFLASPGDPAPPLAELRDNDPRIFGHLIFEIHDTELTSYPENAVALLGRVVGEPKPSPFFPNLAGRIAMVSVGFQQEGVTNMSMLEVSVAGDHAVFAREARGMITLHP